MPNNKKPADLDQGGGLVEVSCCLLQLHHARVDTTGLPGRLARFRDMDWWMVHGTAARNYMQAMDRGQPVFLRKSAELAA